MSGSGCAETSGLDPRLQGLLVCPSCRGELEEHEGALRCPAERLRFPIVVGMPVLAPEHAKRERDARRERDA